MNTKNTKTKTNYVALRKKEKQLMETKERKRVLNTYIHIPLLLTI